MTLRALSLPVNPVSWRGTLRRWAAEFTRVKLFHPDAFAWQGWDPVVTGGNLSNFNLIYAEFMIPEGTDTCWFSADMTFNISTSAPNLLYITLPKPAATGVRAVFPASGFNPIGPRLLARGIIPASRLDVAEVALDNLVAWAIGPHGLAISGCYRIQK